MEHRAKTIAPRKRLANGRAVLHRIADDAERCHAELVAELQADARPRENLPEPEIVLDGKACVRVREEGDVEVRAGDERITILAEADCDVEDAGDDGRENRVVIHARQFAGVADNITRLADAASQLAAGHRQVAVITLMELQMRMSDLRVAIVGSAIGGSAAALLFARAGAIVTVMEHVEQPRAAGAGIGLAENGMAVLASLGLRPALDAAKEVPAAKITDARGRTMLTPPHPAPRIAMVRRSTLYGVLLDAVAAESRIVRHYGACVRDVDVNGSILFTDATGEHTMRADLIIGADGVHSTVRGAGAFGAAVVTTGIRYVRGIVAAGLETGVEAWTSTGVFGSFAVDGGTYFYASCGTPAARATLDSRDLPAFQALWAAAYPAAARVLGGLRSFDELLVNEVRTVHCDHWHDGRLVLLGDAAHAMAPNLGQGANSALVDAAVLVDEMRRSESLEAGLRAYEARRRNAVTKVATMSARIGRLAEVTHPALRAVRDRVVLPVAGLLASSSTTATVMQESPGTLFAIGRS